MFLPNIYHAVHAKWWPYQVKVKHNANVGSCPDFPASLEENAFKAELQNSRHRYFCKFWCKKNLLPLLRCNTWPHRDTVLSLLQTVLQSPGWTELLAHSGYKSCGSHWPQCWCCFSLCIAVKPYRDSNPSTVYSKLKKKNKNLNGHML